MLILNMLAKAAAVYCFLIFYKEMEAGAIHPQEERLGVVGKQRGGRPSSGERGAYDMSPMPTHDERAPIGSPDGKGQMKRLHVSLDERATGVLT